ncbi:unnamed protein product [Ectocarpus sp. 12 AP-2014]
MLTACRRQTSTGDDHHGLVGLEEPGELSQGRLQAADAAPVAARTRSAHNDSTRLQGVLVFVSCRCCSAAAVLAESRLAPIWRPVLKNRIVCVDFSLSNLVALESHTTK